MNPIILAVDVPSESEAKKLIETVGNRVGTYKIGSELFTKCGPEIVKSVRATGAQVFLDLKFYDIPNTVSKAIAAAAALDVQMLTIHVSGGRQMMENALKSSQESAIGSPPLVLGVTVLTSFNQAQLSETGLSLDIDKQVLLLAKLAVDSGLKGLVCSPLEIETLRKNIPNDVKLVTPGIRPPSASSDDQKRIMSPEEALRLGADYLVIGRPIYAAPNPAEAAENIYNSIQDFCD